MNQREMVDILSGRRRGVTAAILRTGLLAASWPYSAAMRLRRWAYSRGLKKSYAADVPVVCVGNITTGGTGKTPMVAWVVDKLRHMGCKPAILTRGYKKSDAGESDEAELLKRLCGVPVVVNADRVAGARQAVRLGAEACIMDDGFQHRRLRRGLDIVLVDATCPFGFGHCLPRGLLREPPAALKDAGAIVITHADLAGSEAVAKLRSRLERLAPAASFHQAVHKPTYLIDQQGDRLPTEALAGRKIFAFCGIGNPDGFLTMLSALHARPLAVRTFNDHVNYTPQIVESLRDEIRQCRADVLVTTQKDAVKLTGVSLGPAVWRLAVEIQITDGEKELLEKVQEALPPK
ncbi:MAG: tetraacyldisaccharide 4'-kinase [Planctomycetota bacterium]|nr:tetraacyldisaccharide 4'-kinase [Planctomycetota bacterium]